ncbi:hypothetical protein Nepgr_006731 [Nepenthes gracilis]|uniref:Uncharacterized protein n=1 Tax=Nepenthes gracilis TaxID=150966 RepID=A0AAD3XHV8_NEPGR|nr:hypothetical protein Nepgr_006731 [Nepenthes gracilis]
MDVMEPAASPIGVGPALGTVSLSPVFGTFPSADPPSLLKFSWSDIVLPKDAVKDAPTVVAIPYPHAVQRCFELKDAVADPGALKLAQITHLDSISLVVSKEQQISSSPLGQAQVDAMRLIKDEIDSANPSAAP